MTRQIEFPRWNKSYPFQPDDGAEPVSQITKLSEHHQVEPAVFSSNEQCVLSFMAYVNG